MSREIQLTDLILARWCQRREEWTINDMENHNVDHITGNKWDKPSDVYAAYLEKRLKGGD